jgi:serine/threonine protein kinase
MLQAIMHPNCLRVFGLTEQPGQHVSLVTERLEGGTLADMLFHGSLRSESHRLDVFTNVCSAGVQTLRIICCLCVDSSVASVAHIHLVARDAVGCMLLPENVHLTPGGTAKILHWRMLDPACDDK